MHRFYCPNLPSQAFAASSAAALSDSASTVALDDQEAHHARRVLRLELGEGVELFNGRGGVAGGVIESWDGGAQVRLTERREIARLAPLIDLAIAIPKGPRADDMINQLSQLGADRLIPLRAARGVVDPRPQKLERFTRAAVESAKQCGRAHLMTIEPQATLDEALAMGHGLRLLAAPAETMISDLAQRLGAAERVLILIGPEGGWTDQELDAARAAGCLLWTLGPHVMRIETAAIAAAAVVRYLAQEARADPPRV